VRNVLTGGVASSGPDLADRLIAGSLTDVALLEETGAGIDTPLLPFASVIKIGGQSIIDRGRKALFPLLEEIEANLAEHRLIIGTGAGTRARHAYSVGVDLGLPTGVLTVLGTGVAMQNARILGYLLARHGIPVITPVEFGQLPLYLAERHAVVFPGMPPYTYWEHNAEIGLIPPHRTDTGTYLVAEVFGARSMIYVKDEDGLYTDDPKRNTAAEFVPRATAEDLLAAGYNDLVVERSVLEFMSRARNVRQVQVINGLKPGNLTRALAGEHVGTIIETKNPRPRPVDQSSEDAAATSAAREGTSRDA
jgi:molybdenum storage protein